MHVANVAPLSDVSLARRGRWHTIAFGVIGGWLLVGLGIVIASRLGAPVVWWDLIHPFTLGALTTAILVYSTHFAEALTRTATQDYRAVATRVAMVQLGLILLLIDRAGFDWGMLSDAACICIISSLGWQIWIVATALRRSLAGQFAVTVPFYIAACSFMILAVCCAMAAGRGIGNYSNLIAAHSRAMVWGFALLTIVGTVVTLLPTLSGTQISLTAKARCTRALTVHCVGLAAAVTFYALGLYAAAGLAQLLVAVAAVMVIQPVLGGVIAGSRKAVGKAVTGASASVCAGLLWMTALVAGDGVCALVGAYPRAITLVLMPAFVGAGLLQMVTGVLSHVLPTLRGGGPDKVLRGRATAAFAWPARILLINFGALLTLVGAVAPGVIMMGLGLAATIVATFLAIFLGRK